MPLAVSKLTAQGQISVPAEVRRKLGVTPGAMLEWNEEAGRIVVSRAARCTSEEIHQALFGEAAPRRRTLREMKQGVRRYLRKRHARG